MKRHSFFLISVFFSLSIFASNLLYDITDGHFRARTLPTLHSMNDGEHYTVLVNNETIVKFSYRTGNAVDTMLHLPNVRNSPIRQITGYEFSPDEQFILVYTNEQFRYRRTFTADYYLFDRRRGQLRQLSENGRQEAPLFSPDSRNIAFARNNNLYLHKIDFNTEVVVTRDGERGRIINGIPDWVYEEDFSATRFFEWSPDSRLLAYLKFDESEVPEFSFQFFNRNPNRDGLTLYPELYSFKYPKAGERNSRVRVFIYEDFNRGTREIELDGNDDDFYIPRIRWTNSSDQLAIFRLNRNQNRLDMFLANPRSTVARLVLSEQSRYFIDYRLLDMIHFSADNQWFLYVSERDGFRHVYRYRMTGILDRQLTSGDWDVTAVYGFDERNNILYFQAATTSPLQRNVYALDSRGRKTRLTDNDGTNSAIFNSNFSLFINNFSSLETPNRITLHNARGTQIRVLEDNADLAQRFNSLNLPKKEFFTFTTSENIELNGWIIRPRNFNPNTKYPVLQVQYSGPDFQSVLDHWDIGWEYYLAENGYIVVAVDGRGTGARGTEFRNSTYMQLGILEAKDQIETAKFLARKGYVDENRIGIWGWSYGGTVTLLAMSTDEHIFSAGISVAPVTDWRLYNTVYTERFMRRPQENFRGYEKTSPLLQTHNLSGRLLIVHGTADDNVHAQNTMLYIQRLVEDGKQFEMQLYTDQCHSIRGEQVRRHLYRRKVYFLDRNLR